MAEKKPLLVYAAAYETVEAALADLDAIELAHMEEMIGQYDAAEVAQHRRLKTVDTAGFPDGGEFRSGRSLLVACTYPLLP